VTIEDLGNIGELLGAIGVIVSLIYVALQIRQNTKSVRAATFQEAMRDIAAVADLAAHDPELARIWFSGVRDLESLEWAERHRFGAYMLAFFRRVENVVYQTEQGILDRQSWEGFQEALKRIFSHPGAVAWWQRSRHAFNRQLQEFVERELL
jgi:hypothetical protein